MRFSEFRDYLWANLPDRFVGLVVEPGPDLSDTSGRYLLLTASGGPGFTVDGHVDERGFQVRAVGEQGDYDDAEDLAFTIDAIVTSTPSRRIGTSWVVEMSRVGSPPTPLLRDDAERTHFVCSYTVAVGYPVA